MAVLAAAVQARLIRATLLSYGFYTALAGLVVVAFDPLPGSSRAANVVRLVVGAVLIAEGLLLLIERWGLRRLLVNRLLSRWGRGPFWRWLLGPTLYVASFVFAGFGVLEMIRAAQDLV